MAPKLKLNFTLKQEKKRGGLGEGIPIFSSFGCRNEKDPNKPDIRSKVDSEMDLLNGFKTRLGS